MIAATYFTCDETKNIFRGDFCGCSWRSNRWITENCRGGVEHPPSLGYGEASEQQRGNIFVGRRSFGQPARLWGDAIDRRGDLGLAA
jgi:hypothetical protein